MASGCSLWTSKCDLPNNNDKSLENEKESCRLILNRIMMVVDDRRLPILNKMYVFALDIERKGASLPFDFSIQRIKTLRKLWSSSLLRLCVY